MARFEVSSVASAPSGMVHCSAMWPTGIPARQGTPSACAISPSTTSKGRPPSLSSGHLTHSPNAIALHPFNAPESLSCCSMRSTRYTGSLMSSSTRMPSVRSGMNSVPHSDARTALLHHGAPKRIAREIAEHFPRCWSMISEKSALSLDGGVKCSDIRIADDGLRRARQRVVIDSGQDANHPVSAAEAPEGVDLGISQGAIDVVESVAVIAGQVSDALRRVSCDDRLPAKAARVFLRTRKFVVFLQRTGGRYERNARARCERFCATKMF